MDYEVRDPSDTPQVADNVLSRRHEMARMAGGVSIATVKRWGRVGIRPSAVRIGPRLSGQWKSVWMRWLAERRPARTN
jgi:hypothetical protein